MKFAVAGLAAACFALAGSAAPAAPTVITQPDFISRPSGEDLSQHYPRLATLLSIEGYAAIACNVDSFGGLAACRVVAESPAAEGFGSAALELAPIFRLRPKTVDGRPVEGGKITIPIRFRMAQDSPPPAATKPAPAPEALALARRLAVAMHATELEQQRMAQVADRIEFTLDDAAPADTRSAIAGALRRAAQEQMGGIVDAEAAALASVYTLAELRGIVSFMEGPAGAVLRPDPDLRAVREMLGRDAWRRIRIDASAAFCRDRNCDIVPALQAPARAMIAHPRWARTPDAAAVDRARPLILGALGVPGAAQLACKIDGLATPSDCTVVAEAPAGLGVGAAAMSIAEDFRLDPILMSQGAGGETATVDVVFDKPEFGEPFAPPSPRSTKALVLAGELAALRPEPPDTTLETLTAARAAGADPMVWTAATAALEAAIREGRAGYSAGVQSAVASIYTEDQIAAAIAFYRSPAGQAVIARQDQSAAALHAAATSAFPKVLLRARTLFCADHPCQPDPAVGVHAK